MIQNHIAMRKKRGPLLAIIIIVLIAGLGIFGYVKWFWVFSDGTQTGQLNKISKTGYIFKTYEGEMILLGYGNKNASGTVQSNEFKFSAEKEVYEQLRQLTGQRVTVHYKKYLGTLPWRGYERSVVDHVEIATDTPATGYSGGEELFL